MIFFREFIKLLKDGETISLAITKKDGTNLSVSFSSVKDKKSKDDGVRPVMLNANVDQLDEHFTTEFIKSRGPLPDDGKLKSNASAVAAEKEEVEEKEEEQTVKKLVKKAGPDKKISETEFKKLEQAKTVETKEVADAVKVCEELIAESKCDEAVKAIEVVAKKYPANKWAGKALKDAENCAKAAKTGKGKTAPKLALTEEADKKEISEGIATASVFTTDLKFINAIDLLNKLDKKFPKDASIEAALFATRSAKAKHEFDADDEEVTLPAAPLKKQRDGEKEIAVSETQPKAPVAESIINAIAEEEEEITLLEEEPEPENETVEIDATAQGDEEDDF